MPVLNIGDKQVVELIRQLSKEVRGEALRALLADSEWDELLAYGQARLDEAIEKRGLDRSDLSPEQIEQAIEDIAEAG